jgi:hypothetical protein
MRDTDDAVIHALYYAAAPAPDAQSGDPVEVTSIRG